jgi:hypothetical protein
MDAYLKTVQRSAGLLAVALLFLFSSLSAYASTLNWSWEFTPSYINVGDPKTIAEYDGIFIKITNDISSDTAIDLSKTYLNYEYPDSVLHDSNGETFATILTCCYQIDDILSPGESITLRAMDIYLDINAVTGEIFEVNPLMDVFEYAPGHLPEFDTSLLHSQYSETPLTLTYSPVPVPTSWLLLLSGITLLFRVSSTRRLD